MTWETAVSSTLAEVQAEGKLDELKSYLRIDGDYDDATVFLSVRAAYQYILDAVGEVDEDSMTAIMLLYAITQCFYEERELMQMDIQQRKRQMFMFQSIILQLQQAKQIKDDGE